ncbi:hypothetical protein G4228_004168 [Cervus hanglu yarkandensis]|nr:hypothetical protein G4228_004168 [Cervus hanglu yarkandensis]
MDFKIEHTWDGFPVKHEPVFVRLNPGDRGVMMEVSAPFFSDPPAPLGEPGKPFNQLWDYEQGLDLSFKVSRGETKWQGSAYIPWSYFPPNVTKFNSFAIHGSKDKRNYEALYPVPQHELQQGQKPDFHRLEYFKPFSFNTLLGEKWNQPESDLWLIEKPDV